MNYQPLFNLLANEHDLILTESEMDDIIRAAQKVVESCESNIKQFACLKILTDEQPCDPQCEACRYTEKEISELNPTVKQFEAYHENAVKKSRLNENNQRR